MRRQVDEITATRHDGFVAFHLGLERAACDHCGFAGCVPVIRRDAMGSEAGKDHGWSLGGITFLYRDSEALRGVRYWSKLGTGSRIYDWIVILLSSEARCTKQYRQGEKQD